MNNVVLIRLLIQLHFLMDSVENGLRKDLDVRLRQVIIIIISGSGVINLLLINKEIC